MIVLGIDPGSRFAGYGVVQKNGSACSHIDNGVIVLSTKISFANRLGQLFQDIQHIIRKYRPSSLAIEDIFNHKNVKSTLKLGHARGAVLAAAALAGLEVTEYTPLKVKQAVVGYGAASKDQVQKMVKALLGLPELAEENASDALAVALCHAHSHTIHKLVQTALVRDTAS